MMNKRLAGLLAYTFIAAPLLLLAERRDPLVRFHAAQASLFLFLVVIFNLILTLVTALAYRISWYLGEGVHAAIYWVVVAQFVLWAFLLYKGYRLQRFDLPWVAPVAERISGPFTDPTSSGTDSDRTYQIPSASALRR